MLFQDRQEAGQKLAEELLPLADRSDVIVLALPRGGLVLGYEISSKLHVPLDLILVRKLGVPWQEELAFGAIANEDVQYINNSIVASISLSQQDMMKIIKRERLELQRRNEKYRQGRPFPNIEDKIVILVDDGIATGATMRAAIKVLATMHPRKIIVAVPVASSSVYQDFSDAPVELLVLNTPEPFYGIGMWYQDFAQLTDQDVIAILQKANVWRDDFATDND
jgi:putative phosphoribosyl transferase